MSNQTSMLIKARSSPSGPPSPSPQPEPEQLLSLPVLLPPRQPSAPERAASRLPRPDTAQGWARTGRSGGARPSRPWSTFRSWRRRTSIWRHPGEGRGRRGRGRSGQRNEVRTRARRRPRQGVETRADGPRVRSASSLGDRVSDDETGSSR